VATDQQVHGDFDVPREPLVHRANRQRLACPKCPTVERTRLHSALHGPRHAKPSAVNVDLARVLASALVATQVERVPMRVPLVLTAALGAYCAGRVAATATLPLTDAERRAAIEHNFDSTDRRKGIPLDHSEQGYGFLYVRGSPKKDEIFRANFGGLFPCGSRQLAWMPDRFGCSLVRDTAVAAKFAVALRGNCTFATKAAYAQKAGAHGLIVINNELGLLRMPLGNRTVTEDNALYIPSFMVRQSFAHAMDQAEMSNSTLVAAVRPFRDDCTPDAEFAPFQRMREKILPTSRHVLAQNRSSPFIIDPPPGPVDWEPEITLGAWVNVSTAAGEAAAGAEGETLMSTESLVVEGNIALFGGALPGAELRLEMANPPDACTPLSNTHKAGSTVLVVKRGTCPMISKARHAQAANASTMIIINTDQTWPLVEKARAVWAQLSKESDVSQELAGYFVSPHDLGTVQASPDDHPEDVHIGVLMVSNRAGALLENLLARAVTSPTVRLLVHDSSHASPSWDELRELATKKGVFWPEGPRGVRKMVRIIRETSPLSSRGSEERFEAFKALTMLSGLEPALRLQALLPEVAFDADGRSLPHSSDEIIVEESMRISSSEPATAFLLQHMPASTLQQSSAAADPLACRIDGGVAHFRVMSVRAPEESGVQLTPRAVELLKAQACLERLLLHNAAALGAQLQLIRDENSPDVYGKILSSLFRRFHMEDAEHALFMGETYIRATKLIAPGMVPSSQVSDRRVGDVLSGSA
jgi:hypothetical protein